MITKITYNSPVILTFTFICVGVRLFGDYFTQAFFSVSNSMDFFNPIDYFRLFSHAIGHANWGHLFGNFSLILLIGPMIEEKYGSINLLIMMLLTALVTGILNVAFLPSGLLGASGIVFMLILLSSITNFQSGKIPLTFIFVVLIYLGQEVFNIMKLDQVSQFAHIIGGVCGSIFGFTNQSKVANVGGKV